AYVVIPFFFFVHSFIHCTLHFLLMSSLLFRSPSLFPVILLSTLISAVSSSLYVVVVPGLVSEAYVIIGLTSDFHFVVLLDVFDSFNNI
ncbi:unnamed protein product, partial [Diabrotica balteata]